MKLLIVPYGDPGEAPLKRLTADLGDFFGGGVALAPPQPELPGAMDRNRRQYATGAFLEHLEGQRGREAEPLEPVLLGVTAVDLFVPRLSFVFGEAARGQRAAIISTHRLRPEFYDDPPDDNLLAARLLKEAVHETGHTRGLDHCGDPTCVMHFSSTVAETDVKGPGFCERCRTLLERRYDSGQ